MAFIRVLTSLVALTSLLVSSLAAATPLLAATPVTSTHNTSLLVSAPATATPPPAATTVTSTREAPSAECHVYVIALRVPHVRANARRLGAPSARSEASTPGRAVLLVFGGRRGNDPINSTDVSGLLKGVPDWLVWLDDHGVLQSAGDFSAGVSSALTFGLSDKLIGATGLGKYGSKCSGAFSAGKYATMAVTLVGAGAGALGKAAVVEGAEAAGVARGAVGRLGGFFSSGTNAAGGQIFTSVGRIEQADFVGIVEAAVQQGRQVHLLTGVEGAADGTMQAAAWTLTQDLTQFAGTAGVHVLDVATMSGAQIGGVLAETGTIIGGFCNSGACLAPFL